MVKAIKSIRSSSSRSTESSEPSRLLSTRNNSSRISNGGSSVTMVYVDMNDEKLELPARDFDMPIASTSAISTPAPKMVKNVQKGKWAVDHRMANSDQLQVVAYSDDVPYDTMLTLTNIANNNNKFYGMQILKSDPEDEFFTIFVWGRVGDNGSIRVYGPYPNLEPALEEFHKKFEGKTNLTWETRRETPVSGKYTFLERSYEDEEISNDGDGPRAAKKSRKDELPAVVSKLSPEIQSLMKFIFNLASIQQTLSSFEYDANKLPLGKLSKTTFEQGFTALKEISAILKNPTLAKSSYGYTGIKQASIELSNQYYTLIPHSFGRSKPPTISTDVLVKKELKILEALGQIKITQEIIKSGEKLGMDGEVLHPLDSQIQQLKLSRFDMIDKSSREFKILEALLAQTKGPTHNDWNLEIIDAFEVEREEETLRWNEANYSSLTSGTRKLLWHGSRSSNFGAILSQGLRILPDAAPSLGLMFGKGIYLTTMSSKAANNCYASISEDEGLLLLCETQCGKEPFYKLEKSEYEADILSKEAGFSSTWVVGKYQPSEWEDADLLSPNLKGVQMPSTKLSPTQANQSSGLLYDEFIVYEADRTRIRYLLRIKFNESE